jgi:hypothetical protein
MNVTQVTKSYTVRLQSPVNLKVGVTAEASSVAGNLTDLGDFNPTGVQDKYLVMYDAATQKYITVDPDVVLSASVTTNQGLPQDFINQLDVDLDNKIDLDAGTF